MPSIIDTVTPALRKIPGVTAIVHRLSFIQNIISNRKYNYYKNLHPEKYPQELSRWYQSATGKNLDLKNPKTFDEKIQWMKLYDSTPLKTQLADKYLVRDYISEKIGDEYLIPLLGVWGSFDDIDFDSLPNQFVLKANHGSGWNIIVRDKSKFDKKEAKKKFKKWMNTNFAYTAGLELHYRDIKPLIIAEKYLENEGGELFDYKILCFSGNAKYIWVDYGRYTNHCRDIYNRDWQLQPFTIIYPNSNRNADKPELLEQMLKLSEILATDFPHVRVDFYIVAGKIYFGEMTFTSNNGINSLCPEIWGNVLGNEIKLDYKNNHNITDELL